MATRKFKKRGSVNKVDGGFTGEWNGSDAYRSLNVAQLKKILNKLPDHLGIWIKTAYDDSSVQHLTSLGWVGKDLIGGPCPEDMYVVFLQPLSPSSVEANREYMKKYMDRMRTQKSDDTHALIQEYIHTPESDKHKVLWKINLALIELEKMQPAKGN
jgi:hypothetical protein